MDNLATALTKDSADIDRDYCNDDCPVFSFLYGLYCDADVNRTASGKWRESGKLYDQYLTNYVRDRKRPFSSEAKQIIHVDVGTNPPDSDGLFVPGSDQTENMYRQFIKPELTTPRTTPTRAPKDRAVFDPGRPVLSALALVFVNEDQASLAGESLPGVPASVQTMLRDCWSTGRPVLTPAQADELMAPVCSELMAPPPVW